MQLCLSEWLLNDYPEVYRSLCGALEKSQTKHRILKHTHEVWCRDYMPLHLGNGEYVTFNFAPDYLDGKRNKYITDQRLVIQDMGVRVVAHLDIVLDGGNVVRCGDKTIMTDKVLSENPNLRPLKLIEKIESTLQTELLLIPWDMEEPFGHADGMVAYVGNGKLLMNNFSQMGTAAKPLCKRLHKILHSHFEVQELSYEGRIRKDSWCYLNYVETPKAIILPGLSENLSCDNDKSARSLFSEIFPDKEIIQVYALPLIKHGGALHCVTWEYDP